MISQTQKNDENKTLLFLGNPQQLKQACAGDKLKLGFLDALQTLLEWKGAFQRAEEFMQQTSPQIRELEGQLWQQIADADRRVWPALKILKTDGNKLVSVYAHRSGEITLEEVQIDE
jgi:hypothetical protein